MLNDLQRQCYALDSVFDSGSATKTAWNDGRRSVWLMIQKQLNLTSDDVLRLPERASLHDQEEI